MCIRDRSSRGRKYPECVGADFCIKEEAVVDVFNIVKQEYISTQPFS